MKTQSQLLRILIVDDSPLFCKILANIINTDPQLIVTGLAHNGEEAVKIVPKLKPDLIIMDIQMPYMDGYEATKLIMAYHPTPILIMSSSGLTDGIDSIFKALNFGALDVMSKVPLENNKIEEQTGINLIARIKMLAQIKVIRHPMAKIHYGEVVDKDKPAVVNGTKNIVAIVSSTGGPQALLTILKKIPEDFPCGIVIVQHISAGFAEGLVTWLGSECSLKIRLATDGAVIEPGVAFIAPTGFQMRVSDDRLIQLTKEPPYLGQCPSGNVLFESVARVYQDKAIVVILSGIGADGVIGLKQIHERRGFVIAQDEATSVIFGMPKEAIEMGVVNDVLPIDQIAQKIVKYLERAK